MLKRMSFPPSFVLNEIRPLVDLRGAKVKDEAWLVHVANALYAIIKLIQWQFPDTLGEYKLVVIMGALHIEDKMRTRYAHQVSLVSLYMLKQNAYVEYCNNVMGPPESYSMWNQRSQTVPQFRFWSMIIGLELLMTRFVRSQREGDFPLQCACICTIKRRTLLQLVPRTGPYELSALAPCACP